mgnify:CR=1 FL=1
MKDGTESSAHVLKDGSKSMELVLLVKLVCFTTRLQKYVKIYAELIKSLLMERTVYVEKTFTESTESVLNVQLELGSDYKQVHVFLAIKMRFNGIQFVFVKLISTSLTELVVNAQMEQHTTKINKFVTVYVPDLTKFGMEKDVYALKNLIVLTVFATDVLLAQFLTETL